MLYLIGVDHQVQHNGRAAKAGPELDQRRGHFEGFLREIIARTKATVIAEESHEDVLSQFGATQSIPKCLADQLGIIHMFCEPSREERKRLGITRLNNPADFTVRESFWLERILNLRSADVVFVLGAIHIDSFAERARDVGFSIEIVEPYFEKEFFCP